MIIFGQCNDVSFACYLQSAAARNLFGMNVVEPLIQKDLPYHKVSHPPKEYGKKITHLDIRTFKLRLQNPVATVTCDMEAIAMRIANQNITSIRNVDTIGKACDLLASDATFEATDFIEDCDTMTFEVTNVEVRT